ncbi:GPI ethanolamine phosphate transferase 3-like [Lytechinus pictus]|uniref:GPI ethanolamine phosphate transferase 3-like n=1 Tax=Lytechinus pictus TaxID=7653 RepID=UPI0030BA17AF
MASTRILFFMLIWFALLYFGGMYLFTKGFLLTRIEIAEKSESVCGNSARAPGAGHGSGPGEAAADSCTHVRFKRAVVLLIDALRYDFTLFNTSLPSSEAAPFQNKMPVIHETVTNFPEQSILFKSLADPPTTTLQRLKGITTGSLPTFVDAGQNFASFEISEDNIVDQLVQAGKRVTFMGDDTWMTLFNKKFNKAFPFPSFNVKDLHSVDEGILTKLLPEIRKKDWDVVIAHFLGVDHCGHSLGPYHPSMGKKLTQMNSVIKSVMQSLEDDTILFVLGDHGMTKSGDHGGDTPEERSSAIFMYSPRKIFAKRDIMAKRIPDVVSQIDFVPTLSLLLGVSIPFSNLGAIISPLFSIGPPSVQTTKAPSSPDNQQYIKHRLFASRINAKQIHHYITTYNKVAGDFPAEVYSQLETLYQKTEDQMDLLEALMAAESMSAVTEESLLDLEEHFLEYILGVREMCRSVWAKFEMVFVYQGLGLMILTIMMGVSIVTLQHYTEPEKMDDLLQSLIKQLVTWTVCVSVSGFLLSQSTILSTATCLIFIPGFTSILIMMLQLFLEVSNISVSRLLGSLTFTSVFKALLVISPIVLHSAFLTSNSHVINEGRAIVFFVQSILTFYVLVFSLQNYKSFYSEKEHGYMKSNFRLKKFISSPAMRMIMLGLAALVCVRCSSLFVSCREEQYWCSPSDFLPPLSLIPSEQSSLRSYRFLLSIGSVAAIPSALIYHLSQQGNLSNLSGQVYSIRYAIPLASVCICMFWGQQALPEKLREQSPEWQQVVFPQVAYVMIAVAVILQWGFPLNLLLVRRPSKSTQGILSQSDVSVHSDEDTVSEFGDTANKGVSERSKSSRTAEDSDTEEQPPLVYGLGTVFSATYLHILVSMVLLLSLLNADGIASSILLMVVEMVLFLEIYAATRRKQLTALRAMPELYKMGFYVVPWYVIGVWSLIASQYFFATGHQATFTAIKFESAYVGFNSDFPRYLYFIPATLVSLNTFGSQIFFAAMLPLILIWPFTRGLWVTGNKVVTEDEQQGELNLHTNSDQAMRALFQISTMFLIFQACDLVGTMVAAAVLRRHLMAWNVFAPRFIFQGVAFGVTVPSVLITFLFFAYMQRCLATWISRIQS